MQSMKYNKQQSKKLHFLKVNKATEAFWNKNVKYLNKNDLQKCKWDMFNNKRM